MRAQATKDAADVRDYTFDWSALLGNDTISDSVWTADAGITVDSSTYTDTTTTVWLSGGSAATAYRVYNSITTAGGRTYKRFLQVTVTPLQFT